MARFIDALRAGSDAAQSGIQSFEQSRSYRDRLAQQSQAIAAQKEQLAYERSKDNFTPAQAEALGIELKAPAPGPTAPGQPSPTQSIPVPRDVGLALLANRNKEALTDVPVNDATNAIYDKAGVPRPSGKIVTAKEYAPVQKLAEINATADTKGTKLTQEDLDSNPFWKQTGHVLGERVKDTLYASQNKPQTNAMQPKAIEQYAQDLASGKLKGKNMAEVFGRGSPKDRSAVYVRAREINPNLDLAKGDQEYMAGTAGVQTTAREAAGIKVNLDSAHSGFTAVMKKAKDIASRMNQGQLADFNRAYQYGARKFNSQNAIDLATQLDLAAGGYARIKKGGKGSLGEGDEASAGKILSTELNRGGLEAVEGAAETEYQGRIKGLPGGNENASATRYSDPTKATDIKKRYKSGAITAEEASKELDALRK